MHVCVCVEICVFVRVEAKQRVKESERTTDDSHWVNDRGIFSFYRSFGHSQSCKVHVYIHLKVCAAQLLKYLFIVVLLFCRALFIFASLYGHTTGSGIGIFIVLAQIIIYNIHINRCDDTD